MGRTSTASKNKWNKKAYDSILIRLKKGSKKTIEEKAKSENESLNHFIASAIEEKMKKIEEEKEIKK